jgi:hypothetical protein
MEWQFERCVYYLKFLLLLLLQQLLQQQLPKLVLQRSHIRTRLLLDFLLLIPSTDYNHVVHYTDE